MLPGMSHLQAILNALSRTSRRQGGGPPGPVLHVARDPRLTAPEGSTADASFYEGSTLENVWSAPEVPFEPDWFWRLRLLLFGFAERLSEIR
jgi:hypothetical protein